MAKSTNKTTETTNSVDDFLNAVADETKRSDSFELKALMEKLSGFEAKMWGGVGIYTRILPTGKNYYNNLANTAPVRVACI